MIRLHRPSCPNPVALATDYKHPDNKAAIAAASHEKCMYCESNYLATGYCEIEHIQPRSKYSHLEFTWENLGLVCRICNNNKSDTYIEEIPFINPYSENPEEFFIFVGALMKSKNEHPRANITINEIQLNRTSLFERRKERIDDLQKILRAVSITSDASARTALIDAVKDWAEEKRDHSLAVKTFLESALILKSF